MTSGQKTAVSLLISILIFIGCAFVAFSGGFNLIEARFYEPRLVAEFNKELENISVNLDDFFNSNISSFAEYCVQAPVASFVESNPSDEDVKARTELTGNLFADRTGLLGIRLIDANGRIHYSTYGRDVHKKKEKLISYLPYKKIEEIPLKLIQTADSADRPDTAEKMASSCSVICDSERERFIYSFPYYDAYSVYRGTIVFYEDSADFTRYLVNRKIIRMNDNGTLVAPSIPLTKGASGADGIPGSSDDEDFTRDFFTSDGILTPDRINSGIVFGFPAVGHEVLSEAVISKWNAGQNGAEHIASTDKGDWILLTSASSKYGKIGWIYNENVFLFPQAVKILLLACIFITLFLVIFLLFNLKHDDMVIIRERVRKFQFALITEYTEKHQDADWKQIAEDIALRKQDVSEEIKRSLGRKAKKHEKELNLLLDRSWEEINTTLSNRRYEALGSSVNQESLQLSSMLKDIMDKKESEVKAIQGSTFGAKTVKPAEDEVEILEDEKEAVPVDEVEELDDLEEVESVDEVEDLEEIEEVESVDDVEAVEEIEEAESVEEVEAVEEIEEAESVEEVESAEEIEEAESVEEVEAVEEIEEAESVEEVEAVEEIEEAESVEEVEAVEEIEEAESVEEVEAVEEIEEAESAEEVEAVEEIEEAESADEVETVEEIEEAESVEEVEAVEEIEEAESVDEIEAVEEIEEAESVDESRDGAYDSVNDQEVSLKEKTEFGEPNEIKELTTEGKNMISSFKIYTPEFKTSNVQLTDAELKKKFRKKR